MKTAGILVCCTAKEGGVKSGTLEPPFRISTITSYLADMDSLLRQRRFVRLAQAQELREQILVFTAAVSPVAAPEEDL